MSEKERKIIGFKCKGCGRINYPKRARCLTCKGMEFEEVKLGEECELVTYTQVYNPPAGYKGDPPLILGIVKFPNGVLAMGQLAIDHPKDLKLGAKLRPIWGMLREIGGKEVFGFKFELAKKEQTSKLK